MGDFKSVTLVSPQGVEYVAHDAVTYNNLKFGQSYREVKTTPAPAPSPFPRIASELNSDDDAA